jgi:4-hydroxyphenylpyruvate dioxygenase
VKFYEEVMGFVNFFDDKQITTEYSALMSKVMSNGNGINSNQRTTEGKKKSKRILRLYGGPGIQHIAIATDDIIKNVSQLSARGVEFYQPPYLLSSNTRTFGRTHENDERRSRRIES